MIRIEELLSSRFKTSQAVGAAFGIFEEGDVRSLCYGLCSTSGPAISENSIFELGSITKIFTTAILMNLVDRQMVSLSDSIKKFFPFLKFAKSRIQEVTLEHLATHYSGLPNLPANLTPIDVRNPYQDYDIQDLYDLLTSPSLSKIRQDRFEYSNLGVGLLGHILCLATQKSYSQLVSEIIFDQLNMSNTSSYPLLKTPAELCQGYFLRQASPLWDCTEAFAGALSIRSSIHDMMQFFIANFIADRPLGSLSKCHLIRRSIDHKESIGLGWLIDHSKGDPIIWHDGITSGFQSFIGFNPQKQRGVVALTNSSADWILPLSFKILTSPQIALGLK
ncbi:MAG: beta-lactamase family protein [Chlamydiia bacterium]|nr:beta-lactamase family protein [Chlamydiia bacterium]